MNKEFVIEKILKKARGFETEIIFETRDESLTRFGDNEISQNVNSAVHSADVKIMKAGRLFKFSINQFDEENLSNSVKNAAEALKFQKKDAKLLPPLRNAKNVKSEKFFRSEANLAPSWRAEKIGKITDL